MGSLFNTALWGGSVPTGLVTVSGRGLIYGALRLLGVLRPGSVENVDSDTDGLTWLNELIDSWATERLMVKVIARNTVTMNGSTSYTALPHRIEAAGYVASGGTSEQWVEVYRLDRWTGLAPHITAGTPAGVYPEYGTPEATLYPYPQPADGELILYQWQPLEAFEDLDTVYGLPAGYALALRFCLADQLAPAFAIITKISNPHLASIAIKAAEYKGKVKSLNVPVSQLVIDNPFAQGGGYDILSGGMF